MPRDQVEQFFLHAFRTDRFPDKTRFSYYFSKKWGWVEFELKYDDRGLLRRLILKSSRFSHDQGKEIPLTSN